MCGGLNRSRMDEPYVYIMEDPWNNPNPIGLFPNLETLGDLIGFDTENWFFEFGVWTYIIWHCNYAENENFKDYCRGFILYDFNNHTHNMVNTKYFSLPLIFINGTNGRDINASAENYTVDFWLNQSYNESVESDNVIGTIYGADTSKTIIVSSLYDCWWDQGTTDSAIGMSIVLGIAKYFKENNILPRYNLKFIAFGGEEYGFIGAESYEARHRDEEIVNVIDLNQLGFEERSDQRLNFTIYANTEPLESTVSEIVERTHYVNP